MRLVAGVLARLGFLLEGGEISQLNLQQARLPKTILPLDAAIAPGLAGRVENDFDPQVQGDTYQSAERAGVAVGAPELQGIIQLQIGRPPEPCPTGHYEADNALGRPAFQGGQCAAAAVAVPENRQIVLLAVPAQVERAFQVQLLDFIDRLDLRKRDGFGFPRGGRRRGARDQLLGDEPAMDDSAEPLGF